MKDKLKNKTKRFSYLLCLILLILGNIIYNNSLIAHGKEKGKMTENEVKQHILEIIENEKDNSPYSIIDYDIDKLYPTVSLDYFVNDYINGTTFDEIIKKSKALVSDKYTYWLLPYKNNSNQDCLATFLSDSDSENTEMISQSIGGKISYDMKLHDEKFNEIILSDIKEIAYLDLVLYGFKATYISMNNGNEYIIPYLTEDIEYWCKLEYGKMYDADKFIVTMYNCYDEPSKEKNKQNFEISAIKNRKRVLNYKTVEQIEKMNYLKKYGFIVICIPICIICFIVYKKKKKIQVKK